MVLLHTICGFSSVGLERDTTNVEVGGSSPSIRAIDDESARRCSYQREGH